MPINAAESIVRLCNFNLNWPNQQYSIRNIQRIHGIQIADNLYVLRSTRARYRCSEFRTGALQIKLKQVEKTHTQNYRIYACKYSMMNNCDCYGKCVEKFSWLTFAAEFLRVHGFAWIKFRSFVYVRTFTISVRLLSAPFNVCARARPRRMARKLGHHLIQQYAKANNWTKWIGRQETTYGYLVGTLGIVTWHFTQNIVNCWTLAVHICVCVCVCARNGSSITFCSFAKKKQQKLAGKKLWLAAKRNPISNLSERFLWWS